MLATTSTAPARATELPFNEMPAWPRIGKGLRALRRLRDNPDDTELALRAALLLNTGRLPRVLSYFNGSDEGRDVLTRRPALDHIHVDLDALLKLPEHTLGHAYATFLRSRGLTLDVFVPPREISDLDLRYVAQRLRQTHDLWHVTTGYNTDVPGEIELQAFTFGQTRTLFAFFVALGGTLKPQESRATTLRRVLRAYFRGLRANQLCFRAWERRFEMPLADVRAELGLV